MSHKHLFYDNVTFFFFFFCNDIITKILSSLTRYGEFDGSEIFSTTNPSRTVRTRVRVSSEIDFRHALLKPKQKYCTRTLDTTVSVFQFTRRANCHINSIIIAEHLMREK